MWWYAFSDEKHSEVVGEIVAVMCEEVVGLHFVS